MNPLEWMYGQIQNDLANLEARLSVTSQKGERSETVGGCQSFTYADAPRAADGGMSNGVEYVDMAWISDGRKPTEGAGLGTGVLAVYSSSIDDWQRVGDYATVTV